MFGILVYLLLQIYFELHAAPPHACTRFPTFVMEIAQCSWENTNIDLGSDHYLIAIKAEVVAVQLRVYKLIEWDEFRKLKAPKNSLPMKTDEVR